MSTALTLRFASKQLHIYFGLFLIITGVIGGILNIIVFTSLKTFRETTCVFYLTITSIANLGRLLISLFIRVLAEGFSIDPRKISWFCKIYLYLSQCFNLMSLTSICLATVDQFLSMSKYRHLSHLQIAHRCICIACVVWCAYSIPFLIYADAPAGSCMIIDPNFATYASHFYYPVIFGCLPISVMVTFALLAFCHARTLASRQVNIVRSSRDRQLTAMVLVHVLYIVFAGLPYVIVYIYSLNRSTPDQAEMVRMNFILVVLTLVGYSYHSSPFYVYCCVSERFRKQLVYVLVNVWPTLWLQWISKVNHNQVLPLTSTVIEKPSVKGKISVDVISVH